MLPYCTAGRLELLHQIIYKQLFVFFLSVWVSKYICVRCHEWILGWTGDGIHLSCDPCCGNRSLVKVFKPVKVFMSRHQGSPAVRLPKTFHLLSWLAIQWCSKLLIQQSSPKARLAVLVLAGLGWAVVRVNPSQTQMRWLND